MTRCIKQMVFACVLPKNCQMTQSHRVEDEDRWDENAIGGGGGGEEEVVQSSCTVTVELYQSDYSKR